VTTAPAVVLISRAPSTPYLELFAEGPGKTWVNDTVDRVRVLTYSGRALNRFQRVRADLREMIRFPGARPEEIGTVLAQSRALKAYGRIVDAATPGNDAGLVARVSSRVSIKGLALAGALTTAYERRVRSPMLNRRKFKVQLDGTHLTVALPSSVTNALAIQQAAMRFAAQSEISGVLMTTSSSYVDLLRYRAWVDSLPAGEYIAGSNALANPTDGSTPWVLFSGFCNYFSQVSIERVTAAKDIDHSALNDVARTQWLLKHGIAWANIGIVWNTEILEQGQCPLCLDPGMFVVRCTSHGSREREQGFMQALHHRHLGDPVVDESH